MSENTLSPNGEFVSTTRIYADFPTGLTYTLSDLLAVLITPEVIGKLRENAIAKKNQKTPSNG